jgi:spermidine/putrescine transport system ATP-binding protein
MNDNKTVKIALNHVMKQFPVTRGETEPVRAVNDVSLDIYSGEFFALLGPSGCGKTTTLRLIAGFEQPTSGEILIDGRPIQDTPPFHRPVNTVFQDYALFPHMSVLKNVMFGLRMEKVPRKEAEQLAYEALDIVRLPQAANRKPRELSGGQQQRVALARAIVKRPSVLLLDEPLGALDLKLRRDMQYELKAMQQKLGICFIYVTHDQEEALTMADRIAVMNEGRILQVGRPEEIYEAPASRFVADFIGETNFLDGTLHTLDTGKGIVSLSDDLLVTAHPGNKVYEPGQPVTVAVRPEKIALKHTTANDGGSSTGNSVGHLNGSTRLLGRVEQMQYIGTDSRYTIRLNPQHLIRVRMQNTDRLQHRMFESGEIVEVCWETENARILTE